MTTQRDKYYKSDRGLSRTRDWICLGKQKKSKDCVGVYRMKRLGKNIACKQNSVCKNMSFKNIKKHGFHVALHDYCAMYIVCECMFVCMGWSPLW